MQLWAFCGWLLGANIWNDDWLGNAAMGGSQVLLSLRQALQGIDIAKIAVPATGPSHTDAVLDVPELLAASIWLYSPDSLPASMENSLIQNDEHSQS